MITSELKNGHEILRADSVNEYMERGAKNDFERDLKNSQGGIDWYGTPTLSECLKTIETGDPKTADKILEMSEKISIPPLTSIKRRMSRGDSGDSVDMQSIYSGNLASAWTKCQRKTSVGRRQICVVIPMQGVADVKSSVFFWRSVAGLAIADKLSEAGFSIKIEGDYSATCMGRKIKKFTHRITLKDYNQPLDLAGLAGVICLAGFKRTYGFANYAESINQHGGSGRDSWSSVNSEKLAPEELVGFEVAETESEATKLVAKIAQMLEFRLDGNSRLEDMEDWARNRL